MAENTATSKTPPSHADIFKQMDRDYVAPVPEAPVVAAPEADKPAVEAAATPVQNAAPETQENKEPVQAAAINVDDISEEDFLKLYQKRTGKKATSIDELKDPAPAPTREQLDALEAKEKAESLEWALSSGKITKEAYDKSIIERAKDKRAIALAVFTQELQAENKDLSNEECEEMFKDYVGEEADEASWKRKKGLKDIETIANNYLAQYNEVDGFQEAYRAEKTIEAKRKEYSKQIKAVAKELPKEIPFEFEYTCIDGSKMNLSSKLTVDEKAINKLVGDYTREGMEDFFSGENATPERMRDELMYHVDARVVRPSLNLIFEDIAKQIETDIWAKAKNARNPNQPLAGVQPAANAGPKPAPPSHASIWKDKKGF